MRDTYACGIQVERPTEDLYGLLGIDDAQCVVTAEYVAQSFQDSGTLTPSQRYAWKALSDPRYMRLYDETRDTEVLYRAGFFDDTLPKLARQYKTYQPEWECTSLNKVVRNQARADLSKKLAVLVTTGGMAPIHVGHVAMMETARQIAEARGYEVLGGFFAPGHDSYVGQKYGGTAAIPAVDRCAMVELAVQDSHWLELDGWAARWMPGEVNFTDVVARMEALLNSFYHHIDVLYVHGSDNPDFGLAFPQGSIQVPRTHISSKAVREGQLEHLDPRVRKYMEELQSPTRTALPYLIRDEDGEATRHWEAIVDPGELARRLDVFKSTIKESLSQIFRRTGDPHVVKILSSREQTRQALEVIGDRQVLSLDPFFSTGDRRTHYLHSTRIFALSSSQLSPLFRAGRPGHAFLEEQASLIPGGHYVLVEDDTVTGGTIQAALSLLSKDVVIEEHVILSEFAGDKDVEYHDVVDLRDFIVGSWHGGLGVQLANGQTARAPYALPYVSLRSRAKVPGAWEIEMSRIIWQANVRFFKDTGILIHHAGPGFYPLPNSQGIGTMMSMEEYCQWHLDHLMEVA